MAPPTTPIVARIPPSPAAASTSTNATLLANDPHALLDSLDRGNSSTATTTTTSSLDPVDFLNRHYTTETMLVTHLPALRQAVGERMNVVEDKISHALQRQSETAETTRRHVQDAKSSVVSLEQRIRLVQQKALQSERAVLEITKDMSRLDCAKRHLQRTITILKRLHMLIHAVEQLRLAALARPFCDYKSASHLVDATRLLLRHFAAYQEKVEEMRLLGQKVTALQFELRKGLVRGFRIVGFGLVKTLELEGETPTEQDIDEERFPVMPPSVMADGTLLIDALGQDSRDAFLKGLCQDHLLSYKTLFCPEPAQAKPKPHSFKIAQEPSPDQQAYSLEQVERRFAWYRRVLRELDDLFPNVFPLYWNFHYNMTRYFLEQTKDHLIMLLSGPTKDKDSGNATILLKALQKTILFEKEMMAWLQRDFGTVFMVDGGGEAAGDKKGPPTTPIKGDDGELLEFDESGTAVAANSAQGIRIRYERQQKRQESSGDVLAVAALDEGRASADQVPVQPLVGVASSAFDGFMGPYIALEEQSMDEQLVESLADTAVDTRGELPVFTSSTGLFVYIKGSITRCTAMTKGKAFLLLFQAFQDSLNKYAQVLSGKLPKPSATAGNVGVGGFSLAASSFGGAKDHKPSMTASYRIPQGGEVNVCHVISTCEYCVDTIEALEDLIRDTIDTEYQGKIDMSNEQESYHDVTAKSIRVLVSGLMNRTDGALRDMASINWATFVEVAEESSYVRTLHTATEPFVATVRGLIPSSYFRSFCDKFAMGFTSSYYEALINLKRISEPGTQQLLLDVYNIKALLMRLPVIEARTNMKAPGKQSGAATSIAPAMYTKMVTKQFKRIETLLKLVGTPADLLIDVFRVQWVGGSALDLQTVMSLKGMKRTEMANMLEKLGLDPQTALKGATVGVSGSTIVAERVQSFRVQGSDVAAKVNSDLSSMRQKVDDFRSSFR